MHIPQLFHREKRQRCIHHLVRCNIWNRQLNSIIILTMKGKINALSCIFLHFIHVLGQCKCRGTQFVGTFFNHFGSLRLMSVIDHRNLWFDDSCLFTGNFSDGVSQIFHMIQTDRSNDACQRMIYSVGRIQSSTKAGLQNHIIHICFFKNNHSHQKQCLKIARVIQSVFLCLFNNLLYFFKSFYKPFIGNHLSVDLKTFIDLYQMWRSK